MSIAGKQVLLLAEARTHTLEVTPRQPKFGTAQMPVPLGIRHAYQPGDEKTLCGMTFASLVITFDRQRRPLSWSPGDPDACSQCRTAATQATYDAM